MSVTTTQICPSSPHVEAEAPGPQLSLIEGGRGSEPRQLSLPLTWQVAPGVPAHPTAPAAAVSLAEAMPDPATWAPQIARAIVEVAHGERPFAQLSKWVTKSQLSALAARGRSFARHPATRTQGSTSRLRRIRGVRCCHVGPGIVEASAVIVGAQRSSAIAFRLQAYRGRWVVTAVEMR